MNTNQTEVLKLQAIDAVTSLLSPFCRVADPGIINVKIIPVPSLEPYQIAFTSTGFVAPVEACNSIIELLNELNISCDIEFPSQWNEDVKFIPSVTGHTYLSFKIVAPWYVDLYSKKSELEPDVSKILTKLSLLNISDRLIFRGEEDLFRVANSSASRYWGTSSAKALSAIEENAFHRCLPYLRNQYPNQFPTTDERESAKLEVMLHIQHMGGVTNLIDFSIEVWVALFFACVNTTIPNTSFSKTPTTGRIWALDSSHEYSNISIPNLDSLSEHVPNLRRANQHGVVVIPTNGIIPASDLLEVARIHPSHKAQLIQFLQNVGVSRQTLFSDIGGYVQFDQDFIPQEALCYKMVDHLKSEQYKQVFAIVATLIRRESPIDNASGYYFRGLSYAHKGQFTKAKQDLEKSNEIMSGGLPEYGLYNLQLLMEAISKTKGRSRRRKNREVLRWFKNNLSYDIDERMWSISFPGFTYVER